MPVMMGALHGVSYSLYNLYKTERPSNSHHVKSGVKPHSNTHGPLAGHFPLRKLRIFLAVPLRNWRTPQKRTCESHSSSSCPLWSDAKLSYDSCRVIGPGLPGGTTETKQKIEKSDLLLNAFRRSIFSQLLVQQSIYFSQSVTICWSKELKY